MRAKHLLLLSLCIGLLFACRDFAFGQDKYLLSPPTKNHFDKKKWEEAKKGIDYSGKPPEEKKTKSPEHHSSTINWSFSAPFWKFVFISLVILILLFVVLRLFGGLRFARNIKVKPTEFSLSQLEENLPEHNLEKYLQEALAKKDYKLAVRIYYLMIIQQLSDKHVIRWKKEKTNSEYLMEAFKNPLYPLFRTLTLSFDWIWYGEKELNEFEFEYLRGLFNQLLTSIKQAA